MQAISTVTPYDLAWDETTMPLNIGGDARRAICLYDTGLGVCDGMYSVWGRKGTNPWARIGDTIAVAGSTIGHVIADMEAINSFNKVYVSVDVVSCDSWFLASSGRMGYE